MSALRQLVAALWATVWVRSRLLAVWARGVLGDRRKAVAGSGYYLAAGEIPVAGVDYELVDLPPELEARLDVARGELVEHARTATRRRVRRRRVRRRRTASLAMAALLTLAVLGAGASALVTGSTGVPAVDRLLGIFEKNAGPPSPADPGSPGSRYRLDPSVASTSIEFSVGGVPMVDASYLAQDGSVCSILTDADRGRSGDLACLLPAEIAELLEQTGGTLFNVTETSSGIVARGYASSDVQRLEGSGPTGRLEVHLGDTWAPGVPGIDSIRPFVAVEPGVTGRLVGSRDYRLWGFSEDGGRVQIWP